MREYCAINLVSAKDAEKIGYGESHQTVRAGTAPAFSTDHARHVFAESDHLYGGGFSNRLFHPVGQSLC
jgi:hypothetical protein